MGQRRKGDEAIESGGRSYEAVEVLIRSTDFIQHVMGSHKRIGSRGLMCFYYLLCVETGFREKYIVFPFKKCQQQLSLQSPAQDCIIHTIFSFHGDDYLY